ncbi:MAG: hypothetical protein R3324_21690 [Halobacteriales archaeon]|nr:hypothetical protein [Halobacteriales archaeon]
MGDDFAYAAKEPSSRVLGTLIRDDDTIFDAEEVAARVRERTGGASRALFSYEGLTGADYRSGFVNRTQIARRLKRVGFHRVLVSIRNQFDVLESAYREYVRSGGVVGFREYVGLVPDRPLRLHPRYFQYDLIYDLYASVFGRPNVLVLQYEHLDHPGFAETLRDFLGVEAVEVGKGRPVNVSLSYEKTQFLRVSNHLTHSAHHPSSLVPRRLSTSAVERVLRAVPFGNSRRSFMTPSDRTAIAERHAESNRVLATRAGITLAPEYP